MAKITWDDRFVYYLIDKVKQNELIWNYKNVFFKNKLKKQQFWLKCAEEMNTKFSPATLFTYGELMKKWNNLKSYFTLEGQKLYTAQNNGASIQELENIESSWKFKTKLNFLSTIAHQSHSAKNLNKRNLTVLESPEYSSISSTASKTRKISELSESPNSPSFFQNESIFVDFIKTNDESRAHEDQTDYYHQSSQCSQELTKVVASKSQEPKVNPNSAFGSYIASEIDNMSQDLQITAKSQIFAIIITLQSEQIERNQH